MISNKPLSFVLSYVSCVSSTTYLDSSDQELQYSRRTHKQTKRRQCVLYEMSHVMSNPVYAISEQYAQSDQRLCCSLPRYYDAPSFYIRNCKPLPNFCCCAGRFVSYLVANSEDTFSRDEAQITTTFRTSFRFPINGVTMLDLDPPLYKQKRPRGRAFSAPDFGSRVRGFESRWRRDSSRT